MTKLLVRLSITVLVCSVLFFGTVWADPLANVFEDTKNFIDSLEWKIEFSDELESLRGRENLYKVFLNSDEPNRVYLSLVMLGLLKSEGAAVNIQRIQAKDNGVLISQAFALCCYKINYEKNYSFLETLGAKIQDAGGAKSLSNFNAIILMSFLAEKRFPAYAESLSNKSQESYQRELFDLTKNSEQAALNLRVLAAVAGVQDALANAIQSGQTQASNFKPSDFTIYVQYPVGSRDTAVKTQSLLINLGYRVPGIEQVGTAPSRLQVRYYRADQRSYAGELATELGKRLNLTARPDNAILASSKELPTGILEVWLPPEKN